MNTKPRQAAILSCLATLAATAACASTNAPVTPERQHGVISLPQLSSIPVSAPAVARAGVPFSASVRTYGSSSCDRPAGMDVTYDDQGVTLVPWVTARRPGTPCTEDLRAFNHEATVVFPNPGTLRVIAYGFITDVGGRQRLGTVTQTVTVQP